MKSFYEIHTSKEAYRFYIGDTIKKTGKSYYHTNGQNTNLIPLEVVTSLLSSAQLEQTCKWPVAYKVIEMAKKDPKPNDQKLNEIYEELSDSDGLDSIDISQL